MAYLRVDTGREVSARHVVVAEAEESVRRLWSFAVVRRAVSGIHSSELSETPERARDIWCAVKLDPFTLGPYSTATSGKRARARAEEQRES